MEVSTISHIRTYNHFVWKWIDEKFDIKWMYLLCFIFVDTAFLLRVADVSQHDFNEEHCGKLIL